MSLRPDEETRSLRALWVDAICINQADVRERSEQVAIMRDIYQHAERVLVWLGEEDADSVVGFPLIPKLLQASRHQAEAGDLREYISMNIFTRMKYSLPLSPQDGFDAFFNLLARPYFRRSWVIQEVAVSSDPLILVGDACAPWNDFAAAIHYIFRLSVEGYYAGLHPHSAGFKQARTMEGVRQDFASGVERKLLGLLQLYRDSFVTDPRDRIFAFWGLASDFGPRELRMSPDYGVSVELIYRSFAVALLSASNNLGLLSVPRCTPTSDALDLPSWVPDWSRPAEWRPLCGVYHKSDSEYRASGESVPSVLFEENNAILGLEGMTVDRIVQAGAFMDKGDHVHFSDQLHSHCIKHGVYKSWEDILAVGSGAKYVTGEAMLEVYWRTLLADSPPESYEVSRRDFFQWYNSWRKPVQWLQYLQVNRIGWIYEALVGLHLLLTMLLTMRRKSQLDPFGRRFQNWTGITWHRRIVRTEKEYIGLVPRSTQVGDYIAVFKGGRVPLVIRQRGLKWQLIGDCYVHGIMRGEVYDDRLCQIFRIL